MPKVKYPFFPWMLIRKRNRAVMIEHDHGIEKLNPELTEITFSFCRPPFVFHLSPISCVQWTRPT